MMLVPRFSEADAIRARTTRGRLIKYADLLTKAAADAATTKTAVERVILSVLDAIAEDAGSGAATRIPGFGTFAPAERQASEGRNPRTGEKIRIAARRTVRFMPGKALRDRLNPPASEARRMDRR